MTRGPLFAALAALLLAGCRSVPDWGDLSAPREWIPLAEPPVTIVADAPLPVVTDDTPLNRWAALYLAQTLAEICGKKPEVYVERPGQVCAVTNALYIGDVSANAGWACALTNESAEAFRVVARAGSVRFLGKADFAVFDWCERALGARFYPVFGKSVPQATNVWALAADYSDRPVFAYRQIGGANDPWGKTSRAGLAHRGRVSVHQPQGWSADPAVRAAHPAIFENDETPMLCYGKPETLAYYKSRIDRHIAGLQDSGGIVDTNRKVVTVCQWDAPIRCACPDCRALYAADRDEPGRASPIIWGRFLKDLSVWLTAAHPDYEISFLPYMNTCEVPADLKGRPGRRRWRLLPNAEAEVCTMPGLALLKNSRCKAVEETILREWSRVTRRKVLNWHYLCWPFDWTQAPCVFGRTIQRHYLDTADVTCGSFVCGGANDVRLALSAYVWLRCLWNPDFDVEALYDEFAARTFGPAAVPMRELIALQERCWERPWPDDACSRRNVFEISYPPEDVRRMKALVKVAETIAVAAGDETATLLVRAYASGFEEFVAEADDLAARKERRVIRPGLAEDMVMAQSALHPRPWAKTTVTTRVTETNLLLTVRCDEPAVAAMDFSRTVRDVVWGNDCVTVVIDDAGETRHAQVMLTGEVRKGWPGFRADVTRDATGWTCRAAVPLTPAMRRAGEVAGNVARWRVGDRRLPQARRVPGSRYEHSRLSTAYTKSDSDPGAFLTFALR